MATQKERSDSTKTQLLRAFRASCLARGYDATTTQVVLDATGLSKGAMYHHFRSKSDMMEALYAQESRQAFTDASADTLDHPSPVARLAGICVSWIKAVQDPSVSKILFDIGPYALGHTRARQIEDTLALKEISTLLTQAQSAGEIIDCDIQLNAAFLNAMVAEASLHALRTNEDVTQTLEHGVKALLSGLKP